MTRRVVMVTGWDRSGTTLVANAVGSRPGCVSVGEIVNVWDRGFGQDRRCACGEAFSRCSMWQPIALAAYSEPAPEVAGQGHGVGWIGNLSLITQRLPVLQRREVERYRRYRELLAPLYEAIFDQTGAMVVVDASKTPWHTAAVAGLAEHLGFELEVHVLHVVRDPRAVAHSFAKSIQYDTDQERQVMMDQHGAIFSTLAWSYRNLLTRRSWGRDDNYTLLRYEDFVADPVGWLTSYWTELGVMMESTPDLSEKSQRDSTHVEIAPSHSISGNPMRFQSGSVPVHLDDAWQTQLPTRERRVVQLVGASGMRRYGYR